MINTGKNMFEIGPVQSESTITSEHGTAVMFQGGSLTHLKSTNPQITLKYSSEITSSLNAAEGCSSKQD